jgi:hypothetical protein
MPRAKHIEPNNNEENYHLDPIIEGLLGRLPAPGEVFVPADRALWLKIMADVFGLIYLDKEPPEDGDTP